MRVFTVPVMSIEGTVTDDEANPIADAAIHLSASPGALPGFLAAHTDQRGHYQATALKFDSTAFWQAPTCLVSRSN